MVGRDNKGTILKLTGTHRDEKGRFLFCFLRQCRNLTSTVYRAFAPAAAAELP